MRGARGYPKARVKDVLGVIGILLFVVCVIVLAAAVTWIVVKVSPTRGATPDAAPKPE